MCSIARARNTEGNVSYDASIVLGDDTMRAKKGRGNYSQREFAPPKTTNPDEIRQHWDQRQADARAFDALMRAEARREQSQAEDSSSS